MSQQRTVRDNQGLRALVLSALVEVSGEPGASAEGLSPDTVIGSGGLGITSLNLLKVFVRLEEQLGFLFEDAAVANAKFSTVGDFVGFVMANLRDRPASGGAER